MIAEAGAERPAAVRLLSSMARNEAWANARLLGACAGLPAAEWRAPRVGFFPSIAATLSHLHWVERYYLDALTGGGRGRRAYEGEPAPGSEPSAEALAAEQAALDATLVGFCEGMFLGDLAREVPTDRGGRIVPERVDDLLLHLVQHGVHHRGQAHAMLSGASVAPPQLDEFHLRLDACPSHPDHGRRIL